MMLQYTYTHHLQACSKTDIYTRTSSIKSIGQANTTQLVLVFLLLQRELSMLALTLVFIIKLHVKYALNSVVL